MIDTLTYAKKLIGAGVPEEQAAAHAEAIASVIDEQLATKRDLKELETELKRDIKELEITLKAEIEKVVEKGKADVIKWIAGMLVAQGAIVATLVKLL